MKCGCSWQFQCPLCSKCYQHDHKNGEGRDGWFWICPTKRKHRISSDGQINNVDEEGKET